MNLHLVAQSHIDPVFMWPWNEGLSATLATCAQAVQLLGEYSDLVFTRSDAQVYRWIQRAAPDLLGQIVELARQRRWTPIGGWWTQADTNLPAGESLIRQALRGQAVFREIFARQSDVAYLVDSFGHPASLPKILAHCGFRHFVFARPRQPQPKLPSILFRWSSDDGSRITAFHIPINYSTYDDEAARAAHVAAIASENALPEAMCFFGLGNHGGGPTRQQIERMRDLKDRSAAMTLHFSDPERFFQSIDAERLPEHRGALEPYSVGCYSVAARLKRLHDLAQRELLLAEQAIARLSLCGQREDRDEAVLLNDMLRPIWEDLLFLQFHDMLPGTAIKSALDAGEQMAGGTRASAERCKTLALTRLAGRIDVSSAANGVAGAPPAFVSFVVFNQAHLDHTVYFEYEPWLFWQDWSKYRLIDEDGQDVPHQRIDAEAAAPRLTRLVIKLPMRAGQYRTLRVVGPEPDFSDLSTRQLPPPHSTAGGSDSWHIRSPRYDVCVDSRSGRLSSILHHPSGFCWNTPDLLDLVAIRDESDTWSLKQAGYSGEVETFAQPAILPLEEGPLRWCARIRRRLNHSQIDQELRVFDDSDLIEIRYRADWRQPSAVLKVLLRSPFAQTRFRRGIAFGSDGVPARAGQEFCFSNWLLLESIDPPQQQAIAVLCGAGTHAADIVDDRGVLRITLARSPTFCHEQLHFPYPPGPRHEHMDLGDHEFRIALLPLFEPPNVARLHELAQALEGTAAVVTTHRHGGSLPPRGDMVRVEPATVACTAIKLPDERKPDEDAFVLRLWETAGRETGGRVLLPAGGSIEFRLAANAIATLRLTRDNAGGWTSTACDGLERSP